MTVGGTTTEPKVPVILTMPIPAALSEMAADTIRVLLYKGAATEPVVMTPTVSGGNLTFAYDGNGQLAFVGKSISDAADTRVTALEMRYNGTKMGNVEQDASGNFTVTLPSTTSESVICRILLPTHQQQVGDLHDGRAEGNRSSRLTARTECGILGKDRSCADVFAYQLEQIQRQQDLHRNRATEQRHARIHRHGQEDHGRGPHLQDRCCEHQRRHGHSHPEPGRCRGRGQADRRTERRQEAGRGLAQLLPAIRRAQNPCPSTKAPDVHHARGRHQHQRPV